jgi:hypothetical protein
MKIAKRALTLYIVQILIMVALIFLNWKPQTYLLADYLFYLVPAAVLILGLLIGWFGYMIVQHSKWIRSFYLFGLNLSFVLFLAALVFFRFRTWQEHNRYGYDPTARSMLETDEEEGRPYAASGFEKLQRSFSHPQKVHLRKYWSTLRPPAHPFEKDSVMAIYYTYYFDSDSSTSRFSKIELKEDRFEVVAFNQLTASDTTYQRLNKDFDKRFRLVMDSVVSMMKNMK